MAVTLGWKRGNGWVGSRVTGGLETGYTPLNFGLELGYLLEQYIRTIYIRTLILEQSLGKAKSTSHFLLLPRKTETELELTVGDTPNPSITN